MVNKFKHPIVKNIIYYNIIIYNMTLLSYYSFNLYMQMKKIKEQNKIKKNVDFQPLTKSKSSFVGNYNGKSNNIEREGHQRIFNKIGDD